MADSREVTYGMNFDGLEPAISGIDSILESLENLKAGTGNVEAGFDNLGNAAGQAGQAADFTSVLDSLESIVDEAAVAGAGMSEMGNDAEAAAEKGEAKAARLANELNNIGETGQYTKSTFREIGIEADNMGTAIDTSMRLALKSTNSVTVAVRAGFDGAFGHSEKKAAQFFEKFNKGAKGIGNAIAHPIATIKDKLGAALQSAADDARKLGNEAEDTEKKLDDMGSAGSGAGDSIKNAIGGAVKAFAGFQAIKKGVGLVKDFIGSALDAAKATESIGAQFDAVFSGTDAADWVNNFSEATHRSRSEVESFMTANKLMYQQLGTTGDAANELAKVTTSFAYDLGAAFNMNDADALAVLQQYIEGDTNALNRFGIEIDDAALKATAMGMGLGENLGALSESELAQVRLNAAIDAGADIQRAAVEQTGGLTNSTKSLQGMFQNFMQNAGAKFAPVMEKLFGIVEEKWPIIEPMLMTLVDTLSDGLEQCMPIIADLAETLIPVLADVLGTLFTAAGPILQIFGEIAQTVLPPLAQIIGQLAESLLPPLMSILDTINTSILQPLMPIITKLVEALLPPVASLLEALSPILGAIAPVLEVIGNVIGVIAEGIGKLVGWLADGVGAIGNFFGGLFGDSGAATEGVEDLTASVHDLADAAGSVPDVSGVVGGSSVPGHASGTENFEGGWTRMNELGGELAFLPQGTAIVPADKTDRMLDNAGVNIAQADIGNALQTSGDRVADDIKVQHILEPSDKNKDDGGGPDDEKPPPPDVPEPSPPPPPPPPFAPVIHITVEGNADDEVIERLKEELAEKMKEVCEEYMEEVYARLAVQKGLSMG